MIPTVEMTAFQADEVRGLLDVVEDDRTNGDRDDTWGEIEGTSLLVLKPDEAVEDLEHRAGVLVTEGYVADDRRGPAQARSLRALAAKIRRLTPG
jgi:hypothetical protein